MAEEKRSYKLEELTFDEINAILSHKWVLSEKACCDVGMEFAMEDFFQNHADTWRKMRLEEDLKAQKEEIIKHKWYLSEKAGYDVGNTPAALDWVQRGYAQNWRNRTGPYKNRK